MATKTKTSAGGALFLVAALIVGAGFLYNGLIKRTPSDDGRTVLFTVVFEPTKRVTFVDIIILVNGVAFQTDKTKESPWDSAVPLKKGQIATLKATQTVSAKLSCAVNGDVQETRDRPGTVTCIHKRA